MIPADELKAAAERLRTLVKAIDAPDLPDQTWRVEACSNEETGDCPCIVAQGKLTLEYGSVPAFYVADAETPECAAYIAAMGPPVAVALADWLDFEADLIERVPGAELRGRTERALAVARAINASQP